MEKRDFLLQEIAKITQIIRKLLGVIENSTSENFEIEFSKIDNGLVDSFGFSFKELTNIKNSELINHIKDIDETNQELLTILILETVKKLASTKNDCNINTEKLAKKGVVLIDFIDEESKTFSINRMNVKKELQLYL